MNRRELLTTAGVSMASVTAFGSRTISGRTDPAEPKVVFEDQESDGRSVVVATIATDRFARFSIRSPDDRVAGPIEFRGGTVAENHRAELAKPILETQRLAASLYDADGNGIARDTATVRIVDPPTPIQGSEARLVEADPDAGFHYPYYRYAPTTFEDATPKPLLAQPVNTGHPDDDLETHRRAARRQVTDGFGRRLADRLSAPFLVPVFPRPRSEPVDANHYVHALDDSTLGIEDGPLERVDRQLLAMADHARAHLADRGYPVADGLMLNGFSASGNFVERFAALHPDAVTSVSAGGINGMPLLPIERADGHDLPYHVGVAGLDDVLDEPFDPAAFASVDRFLYMGEFDDSDTIPYSDAFTDDSLRQAALDVYGHHMVDDRFPYAKAVYDELDDAAIFRLYDWAGHTPRPAEADVATFHERSLAGDDPDAIRADLGGNVPELGAHIEYAPNDPGVDDEVTLHGGRSVVGDGEITGYEWSIADAGTGGEGKTEADRRTLSGKTVSHAFQARGAHNVALTVTTDAGETRQTVTQIEVGRDDPTAGVEPTITFEDQESDGSDVVLATVATDVDAELRIDADRTGTIAGPFPLDAGEVLEESRIELAEPITESTRLFASLDPYGDGDGAEASATVTVTGTPARIDGLEPRLVEADPDAGFHHPYYLYAPPTLEGAEPRPPLVEPVNTGMATDDFERHREAAEATAAGNQGPGRAVADGLRAPFVVPAFPRPRTDPVDGSHYVHALDVTTMEIEDGPLERVDLQLLAMVDDARDRLAERGYPVADGLALNGFSASGNFVDRFATLHPEAVHSVTAGGVNGMPLLPLASTDGEETADLVLPYHVGVADVEGLTGEPFDREAFNAVDRYLYMGEIDMNDTIPYDDAFTQQSLRETAVDAFGRNMQEERFPYARAVFEAVGASAVFRSYEDRGHVARPATTDLVEFHRRSQAGDDVETLRAALGGGVPNRRAAVEYAPQRPSVADRVAFHATKTEIRNRTPTAFEWTFGDGETASGALASHAFESAGQYPVTLTVTDDAGDEHAATEYVTVIDPAEREFGPGTATASSTDDAEDDTDDGSGSEGLVGLGLLAGIAGAGVAGYAISKRGESEEE